MSEQAADRRGAGNFSAGNAEAKSGPDPGGFRKACFSEA